MQRNLVPPGKYFETRSKQGISAKGKLYEIGVDDHNMGS